MMTPSSFQEPLRGLFCTPANDTGGPPLMSIFFSLASAKNAMKRLSGDQNGNTAPSVPVSGRAVGESIARSHKAGLPFSSLAENVTYLPSGEIVNAPESAPES